MSDCKRTQCPICGEALPKSSRGKGLHAARHDMAPEDFHAMLLGSRPTCMCSAECQSRTSWRGWKHGFMRYARGHMPKETRKQGAKKLSKRLKKSHWARGQTSSSHASIAQGSVKAAASLREGYASGRLKHWATGQTKQTHSSLAAASLKRTGMMAGQKHWSALHPEETKRIVLESLADNCEIACDIDALLREKQRNVDCVVTLRCRDCCITFERSVYNIVRYKESNRNYCPQCHTQPSSRQEQEIMSFVQALGVNAFANDRTNSAGYELDVWIPDKQLAIEHNGLYWHSELINDDKRYHDKKTQAATAAGIKLLHVFEDEWACKQELVKAMIRSRLNISQVPIHARSCDITQVDSRAAAAFFDKNHIDGKARGKTLALEYKGEIVCALQLRKPLSKKWKGWLEIARFASLQDHTVRGGYSKLLKHALRDHCNNAVGVMTYVDTRLGGGGTHCTAAGMTLEHTTAPSFWWTDKHQRFNRLHCKATKELSQREHAQQLGLHKIWGCSNLVYTIKK